MASGRAEEKTTAASAVRGEEQNWCTDQPGNETNSMADCTISDDKTFQKRFINGLPVWERQPGSANATAGKPDFAVARVGPATLAVGAPSEVDELVRVRHGMKPDLKITGQLFDRFQALDRDSALRIISRDPPDLSQRKC